MNRVMEGLIELAITAKAVAECKSILFSTRGEGMLLRFALNIMYLQHRDVRLGDQATHKDASLANVAVDLKNDNSLGSVPAWWVELVQW